MKKQLVFLCVLLLVLSLPGCKKIPQTNSSTPLGKAYNAINKAGSKIDGFSDDCIGYDSQNDMLSIYASPDLDYAALIEIMEDAVGEDKANAIGLFGYADESGNWYPVEELLKAYSLYATKPAKRLKLGVPDGAIGGSVKQPELWRDCLERLDNVDEVEFSEAFSDDNHINYLLDIAAGDMINAPFDTIVVPIPTDLYSYFDLSGLEAFSGIKHLVIGTGMESGFRVKGLGNLDPDQTRIDISLFCGNLDAAEFAYEFRTRGFTVDGVSENPRDDLEQEDARKYDSFVADQEALTALQTGDMDFTDRLEQFLELSTHGTGINLTEPGIQLLQDFYSLAGSEEFVRDMERMCSYDEWLQVQQEHHVDTRLLEAKDLHEYILSRICLDLVDKSSFERFLTDVVDMLPEPGDWCKAEVEVTDSAGNEEEMTALNALMRDYEALLPTANVKTMSGEQRDELLDRIASHGLLWGYHNSRYFTGDAQQDIAMATQLLDEGRASYEDAYGMLISAAGDSIDSFLKATVLWDKAYDGMIVRKYITADNALTINDERLRKERYSQPDPAAAFSGEAKGRKVLFAYDAKDTEELIFPKDAYRWFTDENGSTFRAVPAQNTPGSIDEADLLVIAWITGYEYAGEYTDGTKGYRCISDAYAYDIGTGECIKHLGTVYTEPAESLAAAKKYDVYPNPNQMELYKLIERWLVEG